jgi:hypothetical protein
MFKPVPAFPGSLASNGKAMLWRALRLTALIAAPITLSPTQVAAQHEHHQSHKALGKVHFPVSCSQDA